MTRLPSLFFWALLLIVILTGVAWFASRGEIPSGVLWAVLALAIWWFSGRLASGRSSLDE